MSEPAFPEPLNFGLAVQIAQDNCERNGHQLAALLRTASPHLLVVVAQRRSVPFGAPNYTTWVMNTTQSALECLNLGHYDIPTLREAYTDALERERF